MAERPTEPEPPISDDSLLFAEPSSPPVAGSAVRSDSLAEVEGYAIEGPEPEPEPVATPSHVPRPAPLKPTAEPRRSATPHAQASSGVDQVWSRGAEWGGNLLVLAVGIGVVATILHETFSLDRLALWSVLCVLSLVGLAVLAYPLFITLERPVRVTPERALKDYFDALSHLVPHYKRMWLLLATDGRNAPSFGSYPRFKTYWKGVLASWKAQAGAGGFLNPIQIDVIDFTSDKSAGQTEIEATYTARVVRRDRPGGPPIAVHHVAVRLVRGPDAMWYLDSGTLP